MSESTQTHDGSKEQQTEQEDSIEIGELEVGDKFYKHKLDKIAVPLESDYFSVAEDSTIVIFQHNLKADGESDEVVYVADSRYNSIEPVNGFELTNGKRKTMWRELFSGNQAALDLYHIQVSEDGLELHFEDKWTAEDKILVTKLE